MLRTQLSIPRLLGIGALSALAVVIGVFARFDSNPDQAAADAVASYGLGLLVPLATLWLGTSAIGDLIEDRLLVYLWLKPVPRWQLPAAAVLATATIVVPLTALPLTASALVAGAGERRLGDVGGGISRSARVRRPVRRRRPLVPQGGLVGARVRRHLGERILCAADGAARLTVLGWTASVLGLGSLAPSEFEAGLRAVAVVVRPRSRSPAGCATWRYRRADVD